MTLISFRISWFKKEASVGAHLMMIGLNMWQPILIKCNSRFTFGMYNINPISIQIKPIMIAAASWPTFAVLPIILRRIMSVKANIRVYPRCKPLLSIRITYRIYKYYTLIKLFNNLVGLCRYIIISRK